MPLACGHPLTPPSPFLWWVNDDDDERLTEIRAPQLWAGCPIIKNSQGLKKNTFIGNFYFFTKTAVFRTFYLHGQRSVAEPGPTPSPWSIYS